MPTDTFCSDAFYVHTDPGRLPSFAEECSFGNCLRIHTTKKKSALSSNCSVMQRGCIPLRKKGDAALLPPRFLMFMSVAQTSDPSAHVE